MAPADTTQHPDSHLIRWFEELSITDTPVVGGKNASLGELISALRPRGVAVPDGFATTAQAYWQFLDDNGLRDSIEEQIDKLGRGAALSTVGATIREAVEAAPFPEPLADAITAAYRQLGSRLGRSDPDVAVRSSATAEDLPQASFAGQQESFLNIRGEAALLAACRRCYASLFTDRAIHYRTDQGFGQLDVALSVGVQEMVRSDLGSAGVMFTIDTDSGFPRTVLINASWGLGESVVAGVVDPDEYLVFKPLLDRYDLTPVVSKEVGSKESKIVYGVSGDAPTRAVETTPEERSAYVLDDADILRLARWAVLIEDHYGQAMDIEWAKDGERGDLYVVQARPETVQAQRGARTLRSYRLLEQGRSVASGMAIGDAIASGRVSKLHSVDEIDRFTDGAVLVTGATDPDWEPIMKRAAAIVTDHGGRTSHAAIVSRELGVPAIVGTGNGTSVLHHGETVTVSCAEGDVGHVYHGALEYEERDIDLSVIPYTSTEIMLNLADPTAAFRWWRLPTDGVGLARMEFIINNSISVHPMALVRYDQLTDERARQQIEELTAGYTDKKAYFIERLSFGLGKIASACWPKPVIVRMSDFKTNEYARLIGGQPFEPEEENPMLGWRGASRYYNPGYAPGFGLECEAVRRVRDEMGLTNTIVMIPFCRTLKEADRVLATMAEQGLARGRNGLEVYVMAEIPSNVILAEEFSERFDGFSIGSNDLTQLTLGVDRDSARLAALFDERDPALTRSITSLVTSAHGKRRKVGLCGQRPSDDPEFAHLLVAAGIDSISVTPDSFLTVKGSVAAAERSLAYTAKA